KTLSANEEGIACSPGKRRATGEDNLKLHCACIPEAAPTAPCPCYLAHRIRSPAKRSASRGAAAQMHQVRHIPRRRRLSRLVRATGPQMAVNPCFRKQKLTA
ncbi:hypothetical protein, partial [Klebsiella oxytoca]|uniref:hypothetical protein n=1 Tax=Klebsiella oxytoca TaxID=571 RepID=UPI001C8F7A25